MHDYLSANVHSYLALPERPCKVVVGGAVNCFFFYFIFRHKSFVFVLSPRVPNDHCGSLNGGDEPDRTILQYLLT